MALPAFVGLLSAAAPYIGSLLGLDGGDPAIAPQKPSPFMQSLNAGATSDQSPAAMQSRDQMFRTMPAAVPSGSLDPSQVNWVNPDTGVSASQKNLNTPPPVPSYEDFLKQYHQQALWNAIGKGPGQAIGAIFGGVDAGAPAAYAELQKSAQGAEQGRLGLAMPTIINEILSGKRDPNSGSLLGPPQGNAPPAAAMPQDAGAPQGMPAAPAMPAPQGVPGQPGPLLAPPGAQAAFPPGAGAPPQGAPQAPPQGGGVLSTPPGMTPVAAMVMRMMDPVRYKAIVDGQAAPIRPGSYGPADASGNRQMYPSGMPGNPYTPGDPRFLQYQAQMEGALSTAKAGGAAHFEPQTFYDANGNAMQGTKFQLGNPISGAGGARPPASAARGGPANFGVAGQPLPGQPPQPATSAPSSGGVGSPLSKVSMEVQTPSGTKDITQLGLDDLFPNGQGIPRRAAPPPGMGYGPLSSADTERQKTDVEALAGYTKEASENQKIYQDLGHLRDVLGRGLNTSKLAPLWGDLTNVAQGLGATSLIPKNYDPNDSATFDKAATDLVFAAVKKLAGQVRVAEIEGYKQANPNKTIPIATNYSIVNDVLASGKWQDQRARLGNEYWMKTNGAPLATFNDRFNTVAPLDQVTEGIKGKLRGAGWQFPGDAGTPSGGPALPAATIDAAAARAELQRRGVTLP